MAASPPIFGEAAQKLIACNQRLQELGINDTIKVPRIVVIGDQSTGKSSLIEAISTIVVPKAAGLCTKCPIAINLSGALNASTPWSCTVSIAEQYTYNSKNRKISPSNPLGPWQPQHSITITRVHTTQDKRELCDLIDRAQNILLNPHRTLGAAVDASTPSSSLEMFSPNVIQLDIAQEGWVNLSFVDLPGVISRAGKGPAYYVDLVESLARQYAKDNNNVLLLTLPLNHDNANSRSYSIVEREKVLSRTIAVFTKVDLASQEQLDACLEQHFVADAVEEDFGYGARLVMLGTNDESSYFSTERWSRLSIELRSKLGVANLIDHIREILFKETRRTLPRNLEKIKERLQVVDKELAANPPPIDAIALPWKLKQQLSTFEGNVKQLFSHGTSTRNLLNTRMNKFATRVNEGRPEFNYNTQDESVDLRSAQEQLKKAGSAADVTELSETDDDKDKTYSFTLEEIENLNERHQQSNISGEIEPKALEVMNKKSVEHWNLKLDDFLDRLWRLLQQQVRVCVDEDFGHQKHLPLYEKVTQIAESYLRNVVADERVALYRKCDAEQGTPFTLDNQSLRQNERRFIDEGKGARRDARLKVLNAVQKAEHIDSKKKPRAFEEAALKADEWELEVRMSAKAAAYYDLAARRFVDNICQDILTCLIPRLQNEFVRTVERELGLGEDQCDHEFVARLMVEDPERENRRLRLLKERDNLVAGHEYIVSVLGDAEKKAGMELTDATSRDDETTPLGVTAPNVSPKRKVSEEDVPETPTKRPRNVVTRQSSTKPRLLPSRSKSVEMEG